MTTGKPQYDVIIAGGSYAGLQAALTLGRSLRKVLIIDSGNPCNKPASHSYNFVTQDGRQPDTVRAAALADVLKYDTVQYSQGTVTDAVQQENLFVITTDSGVPTTARKLILATGITDILPDIPGLGHCWGNTVLHCPYCHGYEHRNQPAGVMAQGAIAFDFLRLVYNWNKDLILLTNGPADLTEEQTTWLHQKGIPVNDCRITALIHDSGKLTGVQQEDGSLIPVKLLYARLPFRQTNNLAVQLGCQMTEYGHIKTDALQQTSVPGVLACGDNASPMRSVANAVATGAMAGSMVNKVMAEEDTCL